HKLITYSFRYKTVTQLLLSIGVLVPLCGGIEKSVGTVRDGKGWLSLLDMSDARASVLDKKMPFRLLRTIGVLYVPASTEERRKTVHPPLLPSPRPRSSFLQSTGYRDHTKDI
ncbi:unnamed protein product, partial [Coregonus sp. 'balchen']